MIGSALGVATTVVAFAIAFAVMLVLVFVGWIITRAIRIYHALLFFTGECPACKDREHKP